MKSEVKELEDVLEDKKSVIHRNKQRLNDLT